MIRRARFFPGRSQAHSGLISREREVLAAVGSENVFSRKLLSVAEFRAVLRGASAPRPARAAGLLPAEAAAIAKDRFRI